MKHYLTTTEAAEILDISVHGVIKAIKREQIAATKYGGQRGIWLIPRSEIERYEEERRSPGRPAKDKSNSLDN